MLELFTKTERQRNWLDKLEKKKARIADKAVQVDEEASFPFEAFEELKKIGYTAFTLPESYGGGGAGVYDLLLVQETLASYDANAALSIGWHMSVVGEIYERKRWTEDQLAAFAKKVLDGAIVNRSVTEAETGSPTRGGRPQTTAKKRDGKYVLNGRKTFTTASPVLTDILVSAWIEEDETIGFFLTPRDTKGMDIEETWDVLSMRGTGSHDLVLKDVVVDASQLVEIGMDRSGSLNGWMLHIPACYLGIAQAARDYAIDFANQHSPNSIKGTISQLPNVQQQLGEIDLELIKARHVLYSIAEAYDDPMRRPYMENELSVAKHAVTNAALTVVDKAMRVVGAKSLQRSNPLQRYYRDVRAGLHNPPMDDMTIKKLALSAIKAKED